jgi:hypothetical protein
MGRDPDDDGYDFPPSAYPSRELATLVLSIVIVIALIYWLL